jgi:transcriptional regulator with XRE-family HTH domain
MGDEELAMVTFVSEPAFGQYMRQCRQRAGLTLQVVSESTGWTKAYLSDIELGNRHAPQHEDRVRAWAETVGADRERAVLLTYPQTCRERIDALEAENAALRGRVADAKPVLDALLVSGLESGARFDRPSCQIWIDPVWIVRARSWLNAKESTP